MSLYSSLYIVWYRASVANLSKISFQCIVHVCLCHSITKLKCIHIIEEVWLEFYLECQH